MLRCSVEVWIKSCTVKNDGLRHCPEVSHADQPASRAAYVQVACLFQFVDATSQPPPCCTGLGPRLFQRHAAEGPNQAVVAWEQTSPELRDQHSVHVHLVRHATTLRPSHQTSMHPLRCRTRLTDLETCISTALITCHRSTEDCFLECLHLSLEVANFLADELDGIGPKRLLPTPWYGTDPAGPSHRFLLEIMRLQVMHDSAAFATVLW